MEFAKILLPLAIFCICNWGVTTLFDGKGHLGDIYMGTAYALTPYTLIQIPIIILSNVVTIEESAFYSVFNAISSKSLDLSYTIISFAMLNGVVESEYTYKKL